MNKLRVFLTLFLLLIFLPRNAHAYIDPATGSYVVQIVIAAIVGGLFIIKQYFQNIKLLVRKLFSRANDNQTR